MILRWVGSVRGKMKKEKKEMCLHGKWELIKNEHNFSRFFNFLKKVDFFLKKKKSYSNVKNSSEQGTVRSCFQWVIKKRKSGAHAFWSENVKMK